MSLANNEVKNLNVCTWVFTDPSLAQNDITNVGYFLHITKISFRKILISRKKVYTFVLTHADGSL